MYKYLLSYGYKPPDFNTMENLFMFLASSLVLRVTSSRLKRYIICPGCSTLLNSSAKTLHIRYTKDGDRLLFNEYTSDGVTYGVICVQLRHQVTLPKAEKILIHFMNRVRKPMHISHNFSMDVEYAGQQLSITDYWQDLAGLDWKVKGYANGSIISLLYVKNITDTPVKTHDTYLDGFRFSTTS
jgi:hypothetical protein